MGITIFIAFFAGLVSFLSPCVLPIIPGFLAYLGGASFAEYQKKRWSIFFNALLFVLGFSLIFALLGVLLNTVLDAVAYDIQLWLSRVGGAIVIFFGLYLVGLIRIPWLERGYKFQVSGFKSRYLTSFLFGAAFAAGWTPCVGAVLGGILGIAATAPGSAFVLLMSYSLGLGLPFLIVGLFVEKADALIRKYIYLVKYINIIFGLMLIGIGVLAFTQRLNILASYGPLRWVQQFLPR